MNKKHEEKFWQLVRVSNMPTTQVKEWFNFIEEVSEDSFTRGQNNMQEALSG